MILQYLLFQSYNFWTVDWMVLKPALQLLAEYVTLLSVLFPSKNVIMHIYSLQKMAKLIESSIFGDFFIQSSRFKLVSNHHCHSKFEIKNKQTNKQTKTKQIFAESLPNFKADLSWCFFGSYCVLMLKTFVKTSQLCYRLGWVLTQIFQNHIECCNFQTIL